MTGPGSGVQAPEQRAGSGDDRSAVQTRCTRLAYQEQRFELVTRRLGMEMRWLESTAKQTDISVHGLRDDVRRLGTAVQQLETKLDLHREIIDFHLQTIMEHIGVPVPRSLYSRRFAERFSPPPGEPGG